MIHLGMCLYNKAPYVAKAIQSVIGQSFTDWRLTILDNASTDNSLVIAQEFRDPRITIILGKQNLGQAAGLKYIFDNYGQQANKIGWLDADDWLHSNCLQLCVKANRPFVYTSYADVDELGLLLNLGYRNETPYHINTSLKEFILHHFRLIDRKLYRHVGGVDSSLEMAEDYGLTLKLEEQVTPFKIESEPLYFYRQYPKSAGAQNRVMQNQHAAKAINAAIIRRGLSNKLELWEGPPFSIRFKNGYNL